MNMERHLHCASALVATRAICTSLALGVSILALLVAPVPGVGAAPTRSAAPRIATATATAKLIHVPVGRMSITYDPATRSARTVLNMSGLSPAGTGVAVVLNGTCAAQVA